LKPGLELEQVGLPPFDRERRNSSWYEPSLISLMLHFLQAFQPRISPDPQKLLVFWH
jgi:hypothetical protein